ncbi:MAG: class I SAM-dependent methyltransferase [Anaerolineales bacterium]|nr:class I SAM-dependent methyltransferase [Anaerolineales bacterium]MCK5635508.1 class I SAM-dependent methyltransferase [Anaerolineales bacterium]
MWKIASKLLSSFLRFFFKHLYTTLAWAYDFVAWSTSMGQWRKWQSAAIPSSQFSDLLELGPGPGHLLAALPQTGHRKVGLERSTQMLKLAQRNLARKDVVPMLTQGRAQALPFQSNHFSDIIATFPSEYIVDPETLAEAFRVLQPRGELVIVGLVQITGDSLADRFAAWLYRFTGQAGEPREEWKIPLQEVGFQPRLEIIEQERARVLRVIGLKPE